MLQDPAVPRDGDCQTTRRYRSQLRRVRRGSPLGAQCRRLLPDTPRYAEVVALLAEAADLEQLTSPAQRVEQHAEILREAGRTVRQ